MIESIQQHWRNKKIPGQDGILLADGTVVILNVCYSINADGTDKRTYIFPVCDTTVQSLEKYDDDLWRDIEINPHHLILPNGDCIKCGEGVMGNEGFVACEDASGNLKWAFFCGRLNPFHSPEIETADSIRVYTTTEYTMVINLEQPWKISSIEQERWGS